MTSRPGEHAVYPGTFDPVTPGHLDIIERARHLFAWVTVLVAVNADKQPAGTPSERAIRLRRELAVNWDNVSVTAWAGLTVAYCRRQGGGVIVRGVRNRSDLRHEYRLAAMNEYLGVTTLLLPARPGLAAVSSTVLRGPGGTVSADTVSADQQHELPAHVALLADPVRLGDLGEREGPRDR